MFTVGLKCKYLRSFLFRRYQMNSGGIYFLLDSISPATTIAENASENDKLSMRLILCTGYYYNVFLLEDC
jgi:hypothetical protein